MCYIGKRKVWKMANDKRDNITWDLELNIENTEDLYNALVEQARAYGEDGVVEFINDLILEMQDADYHGESFMTSLAITTYIRAVDWEGLEEDLIEDMREFFPAEEDGEDEE